MTTPGSTVYGHQHGEAFALMQYECKSCRTVEIIWNSRDGVTAFGADCRACGGESTHARWQQDVYAPEFVPPLGSRMWIDLTKDRRGQLAQKTAARYWETYPPSREQFASVDDLAAMLASHPIQPGEPDLIVVAG
jgi:hypothetical protein